MNYLLINHIAAHQSADDATLRLSLAWARDVSAAARAAQASGVRLILATSVTHAAAPADAVAMIPDEAGFEHVALPMYQSARSFLRERDAIQTRLRQSIAAADVVQLDLGGHPIPLGLVGDPIASELAKRKLWIVGRSLELRAGKSRQVAKRVVGRTLDMRLRKSLRDALRSANAVIASTPTIADQIHSRFGVQAQQIESIDVLDSELAAPATIANRHARLLDVSQPLRIGMYGPQTVDRGVAHVLAAMHRCWRLSAPVTLIASDAGSEVEASRKHAKELGLSSAVRFVSDPAAHEVDLVVDAALANNARLDLDAILARGTPAIAYSPRTDSPGVKAIDRGAVDELAEALFRAATDRASVASLMIAGHAWARARTLDAAHRQRFELARRLSPTRGARGAA